MIYLELTVKTQKVLRHVASRKLTTSYDYALLFILGSYWEKKHLFIYMKLGQWKSIDSFEFAERVTHGLGPISIVCNKILILMNEQDQMKWNQIFSLQ